MTWSKSWKIVKSCLCKFNNRRKSGEILVSHVSAAKGHHCVAGINHDATRFVCTFCGQNHRPENAFFFQKSRCTRGRHASKLWDFVFWTELDRSVSLWCREFCRRIIALNRCIQVRESNETKVFFEKKFLEKIWHGQNGEKSLLEVACVKAK